MTSQPTAMGPSPIPLGKTGPLQPTTDTEQPDLLAMQMQLLAEQRRKQEIVAWVESEYVKCRSARVQFERQWYLNLAFYMGRHYVSPMDVPGHGFRLTVPKAPPWRMRLVINLVRKAVRKECAKLTSSKPIPTVVPATNEDEDQSAAVVSEAMIKAKFANAEFEREYRQWIWWGVVTGTSFMKSYYDASEPDYDAMKLPDKPRMPDGQPFPDNIIKLVDGLEDFLNTPVPAMGKICFEKVTPFHLYVPDLLCDDIQKQPYIIHMMTRTPEWVENKFGFKPNADARSSNTILDASSIIAKGSEDLLDAVLVKEVWIKPNGSKHFPQGGMVTIINGKAVQLVDKWPVPFQHYPFYKYDGLPTGGFYSDSVVVDLIPLNKEYNRTRSQIIEIKNTMGKPKIMYQEGSINPRKISSEPGQAIPYRAGYNPPVEMRGSEVPSAFWNEVAQLRTEFDDISGQHDISNGQTPSGVTSGTAIAYLEEQDSTQLSYQVASIEYCCELMGAHYLQYISKYWNEDRVIRVAGRNNTFESIHWKKSALAGNTDVRVQTGSALPVSKAAKQALITEMMQNGFLAPEVGLEILDFGMFERAMEEYLIDKKQANRENLKIQDIPDSVLQVLMNPAPGPNGEPPMTDPYTGQQLNWDGTPFIPKPPIPVNSWDNHEAHIKWHNNFRKTQEFEQLSDLKKQALESHVQLHQAAMSMAMMNQFGMQVGGPPQGGMGMDQGGMPMDNGMPPPMEQGPTGPQGAGGSMSQDTASMQDNYSRQQAANMRTGENG